VNVPEQSELFEDSEESVCFEGIVVQNLTVLISVEPVAVLDLSGDYAPFEMGNSSEDFGPFAVMDLTYSPETFDASGLADAFGPLGSFEVSAVVGSSYSSELWGSSVVFVAFVALKPSVEFEMLVASGSNYNSDAVAELASFGTFAGASFLN
jgi:hypothetical protein